MIRRLPPAHEILRERLRNEIARQGISALELSRRSGMRQSFIYDILNGKSINPSTVKLAQVADALGVSLSYLAGMNVEAHSEAVVPEAVQIASLNVEVSAGGGAVVTEEQSGAHYYFRRSWIRDQLQVSPDKLRMLHVSGDSMAPTLHDNDVILVDVGRRVPHPPGIFVLFDGLGLVVKRLETAGGGGVIRILSDNAQYSAYERSIEEVNIIGRVVWFAREL